MAEMKFEDEMAKIEQVKQELLGVISRGAGVSTTVSGAASYGEMAARNADAYANIVRLQLELVRARSRKEIA
jgi:hypothetical protein